MERVRSTKRQFLMESYGLDRRLAVRVLALIAKNIDFTETVLLEAAESPQLAKTLLRPELLTKSKSLDTDLLIELAERENCALGELLTVVKNDDESRTIAFQDDVLADTASDESADNGESALALFEKTDSLSRRETDEVFSEEDVSRFKMKALTAQKSTERIEAIRKLSFLPGHYSSKAGVFVNVLTDRTADQCVRLEAVDALKSIGLDPDIGEFLMDVFEEDERVALSAINRIKHIMDDKAEAQIGVVLAVLMEVLERTVSVQICSELIHFMGQRAHSLAYHKDNLTAFLRLALRKLPDNFKKLHKSVFKAMIACCNADEAVSFEYFNKEYSRTESAAVKALLLRVFHHLDLPESQLQERCSDIVEISTEPDLPQELRTYLKYSLVPVGRPAVKAVLDKINNTSGRERSELIELIEALLDNSDIEEELYAKAIKTVLNLLKIGERSTRRKILETTLFSSPRIPDDIKVDAAGEMLSHLSEFKMSNTREDICYSLRSIGKSAVPEILDYLRHNYQGEETADIFLTLGKISEDEGENLDTDTVRTAIDFCMELFEEKVSKNGNFCITLAYLCGYTDTGGEDLGDILELMLNKVWKSKYTFELIESIGILAGSPNVEPEHQKEVFQMFSHIATLQTQAALGTERESEHGKVFEFGRAIDFETVVIPAVIKGMHRIGVSERTPFELRTEVVKRLLVLWEGVSNMRTVWSPAAVETLVNAMGAVSASRYIESDMRARLGWSLLNCMNKNSVIRNLGTICSVADKGDKMRSLMLKSAELLEVEWEHSYEEDRERRAAILESIGSIAANESLPSQEPTVIRMREKAVEILFQGLRTGILQVKAPLEMLSECEGLEDKQRKEIRYRLARMFSPVKVKAYHE